MNGDFFLNAPLLTGQQAPCTGDWLPAGNGRDALYTVYGMGSGIVQLQYRSPIFPTDGVPFFNILCSGTGYSVPAFTTSPMSEVRAISSGEGNFWCSITIQN